MERYKVKNWDTDEEKEIEAESISGAIRMAREKLGWTTPVVIEWLLGTKGLIPIFVFK